MAGRFLLPRATAFDANGDPISGAKLGFFESGTTTPQNTYSDDALSVVNPNPVIADAAGRFGDIFLLAADYKVTLSDADNNVIWTADPVRSQAPKSTVVVPVTTTTQLTVANDGNFIAADATAGAFIVSLPAAATAGDGYEVVVMKVDSSSNIVTVDGSGSETLNNVSDLNLPDQFSAAIIRCDGTQWYAYAITQTTENRILDPGFITGWTMTNSAGDSEHDIDFAAGTARSDDDSGNIIRTTSITKRIDAAFAEGTNQGGLDTGTVAADTVYHCWAIAKPDGTADALFSLSDTAPTLPSGFTTKRRVGAIVTDASNNIVNNEFAQVNNLGEVVTSEKDTTSGTSVTMTSLLPADTKWMAVSPDSVQVDAANTRLCVQLGDAGGVEATGYTGVVNLNSNGSANIAELQTAGFQFTDGAFWDASQTLSGRMDLQQVDEATFQWIASALCARDDATAQMWTMSGSKATSEATNTAVLTSVAGTANFNGGKVYLTAKNYH